MAAPIVLTSLLFLLAAGGFAAALVASRRARGNALTVRGSVLGVGYVGLALVAAAAMWRLWGIGTGAPATDVQRTLAVFTLLILAVVGTSIVGVEAAKRGAGLRRIRDKDDLAEVQQLTAAAAHDLKSPLRSIYASAALLERRLSPRGVDKDALDHIKDSARRMTSMVDELLRYTKVANSAPVVQEIRFLRLAQAVEADLQDLCNQRMATVEWRGGGVIHADPTLMERALRNLVENAMKYGPEGGRVIVQAEPFLAGLRITVSDEGPGVPADERERIFDVFQRGTAGLDSPGTGLGLATVAKVAQLHSGSVGVESEEGKGSRFWLWIPGPTDPIRKTIHTAEPIVGTMPVMG